MASVYMEDRSPGQDDQPLTAASACPLSLPLFCILYQHAALGTPVRIFEGPSDPRYSGV